MKFYLAVFSLFPYSISCNDITSDEVAEVRGIFNFVDNFNLGSYFNNLLNIPNPVLDKIVSLESMRPPIKLEKPIKARAPPTSEVERHWYHAIAVYCTFDKLLFIKCDRGCDDFKVVKTFYDHINGTKATIGVEPSTKEIIISHRGSRTLQNWVMDFDFNKVRLPDSPEGVLIHEGFFYTYQSLASKINSYLMNMLDSGEYKDYKVVVTGQSLGAAVATVHAADIASKVKSKGFDIELYAYHSPRVGNQKFVDYILSLDFPMARYTNKADYVSHLGPRSWEYVHIPVEFHTELSDIIGSNFRQCSQDYDEDPSCGWKEIKYISPISMVNHATGFGIQVRRIC